MSIRSFILLAAAAVSVLAAPTRTPIARSCKVSGDALQLPANQTSLVSPSSPPKFVALGVGMQNYTCSSAGKYTSVGAVAELFDISCLSGTPEWTRIQTDAYSLWNSSPANTSDIINLFAGKLGNFDVLGQHYFVANPAGSGAPVPKFDFTSARFKGNADAFTVLAKSGDIAAPTGSADVDWLMLNVTSGKLADEVFRVNTKAGQPPTSCTPGSADIAVKYTAKYLFYGGSISA
ncbi:hypothetical protein OF83DRAFT_1084773 [Amylostereum chailletii]|nr:hypothetical protein OF83DRAFT_1084773 [Amylostereum chailletii]